MKIHTVTRHRLRLLAQTGAILLAAALSAPSYARERSDGLKGEILAGLSESGRLVLFSAQSPEDVMTVNVKGLQPDERLVGLDRRPANGRLYALGSTSRIYVVNFETGEASPVGTGPFTPALQGTRFGFDFNPVVDRIRIVSETGQNLRAHPDTGQVVAVDGNLAYAPGDSGAGSTPTVTAAGYINNDTNPATGTVLYDIDTARGVLVQQNPPNSGTLVTVGSLGVKVTADAALDVAGTDGTAYASLVPALQHGDRDNDDDDADGRGRGDRGRNEDRGDNSDRSARSYLYTVNLATGEATLVGKIGGPKPLSSLTALGRLD